MKRSEFLVAMPAVALPFVAKLPSGPRNIRDMTTAEVFARLGDGVRLVGAGFDEHTTRALVMASMDTVEVCENDVHCNHCEQATFMYRWTEPWDGDWTDREYPTPWYCLCGYKVGAPKS